METTTEELAQRWLAQDQDPETRAEIEGLLKARDFETLEKGLRQRIAFGTAGLRSSMKAGFAHMYAEKCSCSLAMHILIRSTGTH